MNKKIINFIKSLYPKKKQIHLHEPIFTDLDKEFVMDTIESTFVSSVGKYVNEFEKRMAEYVGSKYAVAVVNGTSALHIALKLAGVKSDDLVITQALSFVATSNAISYLGASPLYVDIDLNNLGLSSSKLENFLLKNVETKNNQAFHKATGQRIGACVPVHTYGLPADIENIVEICKGYGIPVIEDAAESLGSSYRNKMTGSFGLLGVFSFNGNKTITCGAGGIIVTNDKKLAEKAKHITTQSKVSHKWEFYHDQIGYNYRCPNLNAALACSQLIQLDKILENKRETAKLYKSFFEDINIRFIEEENESKSNYWLNSILFDSEDKRNSFLIDSHNEDVFVRPTWNLLNSLPMFSKSLCDDLSNSKFVEKRLINLPSGYRE